MNSEQSLSTSSTFKRGLLQLIRHKVGIKENIAIGTMHPMVEFFCILSISESHLSNLKSISEWFNRRKVKTIIMIRLGFEENNRLFCSFGRCPTFGWNKNDLNQRYYRTRHCLISLNQPYIGRGVHKTCVFELYNLSSSHTASLQVQPLSKSSITAP